MCSRFTQIHSPDEIHALFGYRIPVDFPPRHNIAPTQPIPVVRETLETGRELTLMRWGLVPGWVKDPNAFSLLINARSETAAQKPSFRNAMKHRRCLIPADGFYEWTGPKGRKRAFHIHAADNQPFAFAGLWESWMGAEGSEIETAAILTTQANTDVAPIHDRMPVIINPDDFDAWLDCARIPVSEITDLMQPAPDGFLEATEISTRVNNPANDTSEVMKPLQGELFE